MRFRQRTAVISIPETAHLKLRELSEHDVEALIRLMTDRTVRQFLGGPLDADRATARAQMYMKHSPGDYLVIESSEQFAGLISFSRHIEEPFLEVSFQLLPEYQGQGIAYKALRRALSTRHETLVAETQVKNIPSRKLLKKLGFEEIRRCRRFGEDQVIMRLMTLTS